MFWTFVPWLGQLVYDGNPFAITALGFAITGAFILLKKLAFPEYDRAKHLRKWG